MSTLLVVDDEQNLLYSLAKSLRREGLDIITAVNAKQGIEQVERANPDAVIMDVRLPDLSGLDAFEEIQRIDPRLPVVIMTAHATTETAIEAMKRGAFEYMVKPLDLKELRDVVARAINVSRLSRVRAVFDQSNEPNARVDRIVGMSASMQKVYKDIGRVAPQRVNVLILGESGTGKELVARAIYHHGNRSEKPFLAINCAAIPETLLESEVFGHERGAFTGADRQRVGKFEQADHGTIFLDEIGDMTLSTQAKLLRVLQDGSFERVGGSQTIETDVRVIAATNQNLEKLIAEGRFRQDLFYRLRVFSIHLPPLRDRLDDLPMLVQHFVRLYNHELNKDVLAVSPECMSILAAYDWPGNVRELQGVLKYAMVSAHRDIVVPENLPDSCRRAAGGSPHSSRGCGDADLDVARMVRRLLQEGEHEIHQRVQTAVDRVVLEEALRHTRGNQVEASRLLGISRTTLRNKLAELGLVVEKGVWPASGHSDQYLNSH